MSEIRPQLGHFRVVERCIESLLTTIIVSTTSSNSSWNPVISGGLSVADRSKIAHVLVLSSRLCGESLVFGSARVDEEKQQCENYGDDVHGAGFSAQASADSKPSDNLLTFVDDSYEVDNKLVDKLLQFADICSVLSDKVI